MLKLRIVSSLEKIFNDEELLASEVGGSAALREEVAAFQVAVWSDQRQWLKLDIQSKLPHTVRTVEPTPSNYAAFDNDGNYLRTTSGLYPDCLMPFNAGAPWSLPRRQWRAFWITVPIAKDCAAGKYEFSITVTPTDYLGSPAPEIEALFKLYTLEVIDAALPEQKLIRSEWFHTDCIHKYYQVPCWSEEHWALLEKYFTNAASHGINMLLTPVWTAPLDTAVGGERPTTQLLDIEKNGDRYTFDFAKLDRWFKLGLKCGFKYFDFAHPFTQWGAKFTPKIMVRENGEEKKLFGWHVPSNSPEYANFLKQLIPQMLEVVAANGLSKNVFFHISDEPHLEHLEQYRYGAELLRPLIGDIPLIDALSNIDFYDQGVVGIPIPANNCIEPFYERGIPNLFTYFCVSQWQDVPNRFFSMPSARTRIMGLLLYVYDLAGFLQWGYNFWYSQYSINQNINPFLTTDAGGVFPSGDAFAVYPGEDGPVDSIRHEVFTEGLQDLRALRLLEGKIGRQAVLDMIHEGLYYQITMKHYPHDAAWLLELRRRVNAAIA